MTGTPTKGPWVASSDGYGQWKFDGGYNGRITSADGKTIFSGPSSFRALRGDTEDEANANARLISAAPELLEALKSSLQFVLAWLPEYEGGEQRERIEKQIEKIHAALRKAEQGVE